MQELRDALCDGSHDSKRDSIPSVVCVRVGEVPTCGGFDHFVPLHALCLLVVVVEVDLQTAKSSALLFFALSIFFRWLPRIYAVDDLDKIVDLAV